MGGPLQAQVDTAVVQAAAWAGCTKFRLSCTSPLRSIVSGSTSRAPRLCRDALVFATQSGSYRFFFLCFGFLLFRSSSFGPMSRMRFCNPEENHSRQVSRLSVQYSFAS